MRNRRGGVWEERQTRNWFWIEKRENRYFSSGCITCVDAVRILKGQQPIPRTCCEVEDIAGFVPVSKEVIKMLTRAVDGLTATF